MVDTTPEARLKVLETPPCEVQLAEIEAPGSWMTQNSALIYRPIPKCACSTIGQILHFADRGAFYDGDIHDDRRGLVKWSGSDDEASARTRIREAVASGAPLVFSCVRNPYTRLLSAFFDKICGIQRSGHRYRGKFLVPVLIEKYGVDIEGDFDQIAAFRKFLLFVRDTIRFRKPMPPDIHWSSMTDHAATLVLNGVRYDRIISAEAFADGIAEVFTQVSMPYAIDSENLPRFNESSGHGPKRAHPVAAYYDDLACHIINEIYDRDFRIFRYDRDPGDGGPQEPLDIDDINRRLSWRPS